MTFIKTYKKEDIILDLKRRGRYFARMLDDTDLQDIVSDCVRKLDENVSTPRDLIITAGVKEVDLTGYNVDSVAMVYYSNDQVFTPLGPDVGLLPLILKGQSNFAFGNVIDFLQMKASLNIMNRQLRTAPDHEFMGGKIYFNKAFKSAIVEFLPYFDGEADSWDFFQMEYHYVLNRSWCLLNLRNGEAMMSATVLGVGKEAQGVVDHWQKKLSELDTEWLTKGVISYVG